MKYKPKQPKKGEYKEQNGRTHIHEDKRTTYKGESQRGTSSSPTLPIARSISNEERGGPGEKMPSLEEPSPISTTRHKIEIVCTCCSAIDTFCL
jgi:hypothetical protein